jgi:hypothetical protein
MPPERREQIANSKRGVPRPPETCKRISQGQKGTKRGPLSIECRMKISNAQKARTNNPYRYKKGQIPWNKGKKGLQVGWKKGLTDSPELREKQSVEAKKRWKEGKHIPFWLSRKNMNPPE